MTEQTESAWPTPPAPGTMKPVSPLALATITSGIVLVGWGAAHEAAEWLIGHPIWTHEFPAYADELKRLALEQYPDLPVEIGDEEADWRKAMADITARYGDTVEIAKGAGERAEGQIATAARLFGGATA